MNRRLFIVLFICAFLINLMLSGQEKTRLFEINEKCLIINHLIDSTKYIDNDSNRLYIGKKIGEDLEKILSQAISYSNPFDSLKRIGKVYSPDAKFRLFTWNIQLTDASNKFYAILQLNPGKDSICKLIFLNDKSQNFTGNINTAVFDAKNWFGALYYDIIPEKISGKTYYALLGMHFNGLFTNKKIIESMYFDDLHNPVFGSPIFVYNNSLLNRILFEYSINATMSLRFDNRLKMIIFDHLSPPSPLYNGDFKFYGPDFSFDGLKFIGNKWEYQANVDFHQ
jgi:hypothetical protein